jgi:hypothetical protein
MRHIATLIAAAIIAPVAWVLLAFGQDRSVQIIATGDHAGYLHGSAFARPALVLAAAGILLGLIATLRFSPLGAVVAGAFYAGSYLLLMAAPGTVLRLFRHNLSIAGKQADASTPLRTGTTLLLGGLLLVAVVSVGRWRRWPRTAESTSDLSDPWSGELGATSSGGSLGGGLRLGTEPEMRERYPTQRPSATVDASESSWAASLRSGYGERDHL